VELCNGADEDCDGRSDEDFRVGRSIDHCGGCGDACSRNNATPECIDGACVLVACDEGFRDENGDVEDGCEVEAPPGRTVFVDASAEGEGDGNADRPFLTIHEALEDLAPNTRIIVRPGLYEGAIGHGVDGVSIEGVGAVTVRAQPDASGAVFIDGDHASISGIRVDQRCVSRHRSEVPDRVQRGEQRSRGGRGRGARAERGGDHGLRWPQHPSHKQPRGRGDRFHRESCPGAPPARSRDLGGGRERAALRQPGGRSRRRARR